MPKASKEQHWESWVKDLYTNKFDSFLKAEAHISDLTDDFFRYKSDAPFVKTRPKSLSSFTEKVQKKLDEKSGNILKFVSGEERVKNLFFDKRGRGDLVGMRLIYFPYEILTDNRVSLMNVHSSFGFQIITEDSAT